MAKKIPEGFEVEQPGIPEGFEVEDRPSIPERIVGGAETALSVGSGLIAEPVAGWAGIAAGLNPFAEEGAAARRVEQVREALTYEPRTESGRAGVREAGETVAPIAEPLMALEKSMGDYAFDKTQSPALAALAQTIPSAILELSGAGTAKRAAAPIRPRFEADQKGLFKPDEPEEAVSAQQAAEASERSGVDLFKAQRTLNPSDIERQSFIATLPESAAKARRALSKQNQQAANAVDTYIQQLTGGGATDAPTKIRSATERAIEAKKAVRAEAASPIYKQAFRRQRQGKLPPIDTSSLIEKIQGMAKQFDPDGEIAKNLNRAAKKIQAAGGDLRKLHSAKIELDQTLTNFGENAVGRTTKRYLTDVTTDLRNTLAEQSPSYRAALEEYRKASPEVEALTEGLIGKVSRMGDDQLKSVSSALFDPGQTKESLSLARKAIKDVDPQAWDDLVAYEMQRRIGRVRSNLAELSESASPENVPGQLYTALFGNEKMRNVLFNSVEGEAKKNLQFLKTALERASKGRPGGSQTAIREEIKREMRGGVVEQLREWINPVDAAGNVLSEAEFNRRANAMFNILFDPTWQKQMEKIRQMPQNSEKAGRALEGVLSSALIALPSARDQNQEEQ